MVKRAELIRLQQLNRDTLYQLAEVLDRLDPTLYTAISSIGNATVGQHVRHTLEFYQCLFMAEDEVNYDARKRDPLLESDPVPARREIDVILSAIEQVTEDRPLMLITDVNEQNRSSLRFPSSFARELFYVLEHAVHHMALVRTLIKERQPSFHLDEGFGLAYSTLTYRGQTANN